MTETQDVDRVAQLEKELDEAHSRIAVLKARIGELDTIRTHHETTMMVIMLSNDDFAHTIEQAAATIDRVCRKLYGAFKAQIGAVLTLEHVNNRLVELHVFTKVPQNASYDKIIIPLDSLPENFYDKLGFTGPGENTDGVDLSRDAPIVTGSATLIAPLKSDAEEVVMLQPTQNLKAYYVGAILLARKTQFNEDDKRDFAIMIRQLAAVLRNTQKELQRHFTIETGVITAEVLTEVLESITAETYTALAYLKESVGLRLEGLQAKK